jgi:hypothetical protein
MNENRVVAQLSNSAGEKEQKYMFYCERCKQNHMFDERWMFNVDIRGMIIFGLTYTRFGHMVME